MQYGKIRVTMNNYNDKKNARTLSKIFHTFLTQCLVLARCVRCHLVKVEQQPQQQKHQQIDGCSPHVTEEPEAATVLFSAAKFHIFFWTFSQPSVPIQLLEGSSLSAAAQTHQLRLGATAQVFPPNHQRCNQT